MSQPVQNGKGSKSRINDYKKYTDNYREIDWRTKGEFCFNCGKTFRIDEKRIYYEDGNAYCLIECNFN